jgi:hypothetical protein
MPTTAVENLIVSSIHGAFIKYPEGDGGPNLDYEWIAPDQSAHITKGYPSGLGRQWLCDCEAESVTHLGAMSASGSRTDLTRLKCDVRFSPENRRVSDVVTRWAFCI